MAERVVIAELDINAEAFIKSTANIKKQIDQLKKDQKELSKVGGESSKAYVQNAADLKVLSQAYNANIKTLAQNTKATADAIAREELLSTVLKEEVNSIQEARNQNKLLNKLRNETNVSTEQGKKELEALNGALDSNNNFIKDNADQYLQQKINIGNYQSALQGVSPQLATIVKQLEGFYGQLLVSKSALQATTAGLSGTSKALKIFRLALISTGIGAIVVALGSLITFLSTTQKGIDAVTSVTRPLKAIFQSLIGVFQNVGENLFDAFNNPKKTIEDLGNFIKNNLINRFKAFGVILEAIQNRDLKGLINGFAQVGTGVENITEKITNASKETGKFFADAAAKGAEIDRITKEIEKSEISLNLERQKGLTRIKELDRIAKDTSRNTEERLKANEEQNKIAQETEAREQAVINLKIERLKIEQTLNDTSREGNQELKDLQAELEQSKQRALDEELKGIRVISQAQKEAQAQAKQIADNAIKKQEDLLNLFIAQQGTRAKTLQEQLDLDKDIAKQREEILKAELKNRNITQTEFDTKLLNIKNDLAKKQSDIVVNEAQRELDDFIQNNQSKIDSEQFFSDESLRIEQERINAISEKQKESAEKQLTEGVINREEYNAAINKIDEENRIANAEAQTLRDEAQKEADVINLENQRILDQQNFETKLEADLANLEIQKKKELQIARDKGASEQLIIDKYANAKEQIEQEAATAKIQANAAAFGSIADFLGKESALGKAAALAQAGLNIQVGITKALASKGFAGIVEGVLIAAKGAVSVAKIAGVNTKFEQGGIASIDGARHSQGGVPIFAGDKYIGEAEGGEGIGILNRSAYASFMDFNNSFGNGNSRAGFYEGGGIITQSIPDSESSNAELLQAIQNMKAPIVTVEDIRRGSKSFVEVETVANV